MHNERCMPGSEGGARKPTGESRQGAGRPPYAYSQGGHVRARFHNALGSAAEVRACLDVAEAMGYVDHVDPELRNTLDRIVATVHRLARR